MYCASTNVPTVPTATPDWLLVAKRTQPRQSGTAVEAVGTPVEAHYISL